MTTFVLYHKKSRPTGEVLGRVLRAEHGETMYGRSARDVLIRWGSRAAGFHGTELTLNGVDAITRASDKLASLKIMRDAGVQVPDFSTDPEELTLPFLGRRVSHSKARDVVLCLQKGDYLRNSRDYYVKYIPTTREFRVHVVGDEVVRVQGKFVKDVKLARSLPWVRNHAAGYVFKKPKKTLRPDRTNMAVAAVKALGLDFGAVDLLIGDDGQTYVLEVNTAPSCSPLTMRAYVEAFMKKLGLERNDVRFSLLSTLSETEEDETDDDAGIEIDDEVVEQAVRDREPAPAVQRSVTAEGPGNSDWICDRCENRNAHYTHTCTTCGYRQEDRT